MTNENKAPKELSFGEGGTYTSHSKEIIQTSFLMALTSHTGLNMTDIIIDNDAIDVQIRGKDFLGNWKAPKIDLQLKCTSQDLIDTKHNVLKFDLDARSYNLLSAYSPYPQILVVNVISEDQHEWISQDEKGIKILTKSYWYSLFGMETLMESSTQKRLYIPTSQVFNSTSLMQLMNQSSNCKNVRNIGETHNEKL